MKKSEKQSPETHREFLDLDTDDEDFGPRKTPETEEELPVEPEKPVFSNEDLNTLVRHVQDLTIIPSIQPADWSEECCRVIREFFQDPSYTTLIIYYEDGKLNATLRSLDYCDSTAFAYFTRAPWHVYTVDNFLTTVLFGVINRDANNSILKFMQNLIILNFVPSVIQNALFSSLHGFLVCFTDYVYKLRDRTVLYIPREGLQEARKYKHSSDVDIASSPDESSNSSFQESPEDKEKLLVQRLENVVSYWIKQIREALANMYTRKKLENLKDEVKHWETIYSNFKYLHDNQLQGGDVQSIIRILSNVCSAKVEPFRQLITRVRNAINESRSNLEYLKLLPDAEESDDLLSEIHINITRTIYLSFFIWQESPFYKTRYNMEKLYQTLSTQIILRCQEYANHHKIFEGDAENVISVFTKCILYCEMYKKVFSILTQNILSYSNNENQSYCIDNESIFQNIDVFVKRCHDVIDICDANTVFGRCNKVGMLGGPKGIEHERCCRNIKNIFHENLMELSMAQHIILDVHNYKWIEKFHKFKTVVSQLEYMVRDLIDFIFENVTSVQEGIEAIYALQIFKKRKCLRELIEKKWNQVWLIFDEEIESCSISIIDEIKTPSFSFYHLGLLSGLSIKQRYLNQQYEMMINASDWFDGNSVQAKYTLKRYKSVLDAIIKYKNILSTTY
ncbi:uncharacterized protein [Prorops nasuta]|uniref:uncharacterized protein isoform X2 n=1 Tax=Prorops nasuta TaxID=863751 RepID=UPI0034CD3375